MTSRNLLPWLGIRRTNSAPTTNWSSETFSAYYQLNINYNLDKETVHLQFRPQNYVAEKEIEDKTVYGNKKSNKHSTANNIHTKDMFKQPSTLIDTKTKSIQVPSTEHKNNEKEKQHRGNRESRSSAKQSLMVTDSVNTNLVTESNDLISQKILTSRRDKSLKSDKKKKHKHRKSLSQETCTITDNFSIENSKYKVKIFKNKPKKHKHRREHSHDTATVSEKLSKENCKDQIKTSKDAPKKHKYRRERSKEIIAVTGTFSKEYNIKVSKGKTVKDEILQTLDNDKESEEITTKLKKESKSRKDKLLIDSKNIPQLQDIIANLETASNKNTQIYYVQSAIKNPLEVSAALRAKNKDPLGKHSNRSKKKRKLHPSLETKYEKVQNTTSSSTVVKFKSQEEGKGVKEIMPVENKKEGIRFFFIRKKKNANLKADQKRKKSIAKGNKTSSEGIKCKHTTIGGKLSVSSHLVDAANLKKGKLRKHATVKIGEDEVSIGSKIKSRSQSVDTKTFKKHVDRDSVETLHCVGDFGAKLKKKSPSSIRHASLEKSDIQLEVRHTKSKRQSKSETNIKHKEIKQDLINDQKHQSSKKASNKNEEKNYKKHSLVENKPSDGKVLKTVIKDEDSNITDKAFLKKEKHKSKHKHRDAVTDTKGLHKKKSDDCTKNAEGHKNESQYKTKTQDKTQNLYANKSTETLDIEESVREEAQESYKKRKRSKKDAESDRIVEKKPTRHKVTEPIATAVDVSEKKHKKSRQSNAETHICTTTEEVSPKTSEEIQKVSVPDSSTESKETLRKSRRRKTKTDIKSLKDNIMKYATKFPENMSESTLPTEHIRTASTTDNSVFVYKLPPEKNDFSEITSIAEDKQFTERQKRPQNDAQKIIKITQEQLDAILNKINRKPNLKQSKTLYYKLPISEEKSTELKGIRKEVSFTHLNVKPVTAHYAASEMTSNFCNRKPFDSIIAQNSAQSFPPPVLCYTLLKEKKQTKPKKKSKIPDQKSVVSEAVTKKEKFQYVNGRRYPANRTVRNFAYSENIFERSRKALRESEFSTIGFTVEGVEPPKMLKPDIVPSCLIKQKGHNLKKELHVAVVSVMEIKPQLQDLYEGEIDRSSVIDYNFKIERREVSQSSSVLNAEAAPTAINEDFTENNKLGNKGKKQLLFKQFLQGVPHAQTFTSLLDPPPQSDKFFATPLESNTQTTTYTKEDAKKIVTDLSGQNKQPERSLKEVEKATHTNERAKSMEPESNTKIPVEEIIAISKKHYMQENRNIFEEHQLNKEELAALGQEVFTRMKEYMKDRHKPSKEENPIEKPEVTYARKSVEEHKEHVPPGQEVRSRMNKYIEELNERRRKRSRSSSTSSREPSPGNKSTEDKNLISVTNDNEATKGTRGILNESVTPSAGSPRRYTDMLLEHRLPSHSKTKHLTSAHETSTERKHMVTKNTRPDEINKVTTMSRDSSNESIILIGSFHRKPPHKSVNERLSSPSKRDSSPSRREASAERQNKDETTKAVPIHLEGSNESVSQRSGSPRRHRNTSVDNHSSFSRRRNSLPRKDSKNFVQTKEGSKKATKPSRETSDESIGSRAASPKRHTNTPAEDYSFSPKRKVLNKEPLTEKESKNLNVKNYKSNKTKIARDSSNESIASIPRSRNRYMHTSLDNRPSYSKKRSSTSGKEIYMERKGVKTKDLNLVDEEINKSGTVSLETSAESIARRSRSPRRRTHLTVDAHLKRQRLPSDKEISAQRNGVEAEKVIMANDGINKIMTISRESSDDSVVTRSSSPRRHIWKAVNDRPYYPFKEKSSTFAKKGSTKPKISAINGENEKDIEIPGLDNSCPERTKKSSFSFITSPLNRTSAEKKERYFNRYIRDHRKRRKSSGGSTSSGDLSSAIDAEKYPSKLQISKNVANLKFNIAEELKNIINLKEDLQKRGKYAAATLEKSETFLCDSFSGEIETKLNDTKTDALNLAGNISSEDTPPLAKITEETSSQYSLDNTYSYLPHKSKFYNRNEKYYPPTYLKRDKFLKFEETELHASTAKKSVKGLGKKYAKQKTTPEKIVTIDEKQTSVIEQDLGNLSHQMSERILGMLNLNSQSTSKHRNFFNSNKPLLNSDYVDPEYLSEDSVLQQILPNLKPYCEREELQGNETQNISDREQFTWIATSRSNVKPTKKPVSNTKATGKQKGVPEIKCSSCSIHNEAQHIFDGFDTESTGTAADFARKPHKVKHFDNESNNLSFASRDYDDDPKKITDKKSLLSDYSLEKNTGGKCGMGSCFPTGKSKIPVKKEVEDRKLMKKVEISEKPMQRKEESEKHIRKRTESEKSIKHREESERSIGKREKSERSIRKRKESERSIQKNEESDRSVQKREKRERSETRNSNSKDEQPKKMKGKKEPIEREDECNSNTCLTMIDSKTQSLNTGNARGTNKNLDDKEIQRLANLVKMNVMKELDAAHLLKPNTREEEKKNRDTKQMKQLNEIIERNIEIALKQRVYAVMHSVEIDESGFKTLHLPETIPFVGAQQLDDFKSQKREDDVSGSRRTEITKVNQEEEVQQTSHKIPETVSKSNHQTIQEPNDNSTENVRKSENKSAPQSTKKNVASSHNTVILQANSPNSACKISDCQMACCVKYHQSGSDVQRNKEEKKDAILEKLISMISGEPDFLYLESRLDQLLGFPHEPSPKTTNNDNVEKIDKVVASHNSENNETTKIVGARTVMHVEAPKGPFSYKKTNQISYSVPTRKCKIRKDRISPVQSKLKVKTKPKNKSDNKANVFEAVKPLTPQCSKKEVKNRSTRSDNNADIFEDVKPLISPSSQKEVKNKNSRSDNKAKNVFEAVNPLIAQSSKNEITSRSTRSQISKIPTLIKPVPSVSTKYRAKSVPGDTSETYSNKTEPRNSSARSSSSTIKESKRNRAVVRSKTDLQESKSTRFLTKLLDIELVEHSENRTYTSCSSKLNPVTSKTKPSSCLYTKNYKSGKQLSAYEKRKQYGESLRFKKINSINENTIDPSSEAEKGVNQDCIYCYPEDIRGITTDHKLQKGLKMKMPPSRPPPSKFVNRRSEPPALKQPEVKVLSSSESYGYNSHGELKDQDLDPKKLGCFLCTKLSCTPKNSTPIAEAAGDDGSKMLSPPKTKKPNKYSTLPSIIRPIRSNRNLKPNFQHRSAPDEREERKGQDGHVYHTYNVVANHPNVTDVFRNKFKAESSISLFSRESMFSCDNFSPCFSLKSTASICSANTFRSRTLYNPKSSSLLNTNCSDETHNPVEVTKRLSSYRKIVRGPRLRKRNSIGRATYNLERFYSPSKEFFGTIEQNLKDGLSQHKKTLTSSPLNITSSYEFYHSTPAHMHVGAENTESVEEQISPYNRSARIPRRKVSLLEACQHLKNRNHCYKPINEHRKTYTHEKQKVFEITSDIPNSNKVYQKRKETATDKHFQDNYNNADKNTFFKDTKSLIHQSLKRTSKRSPYPKSKSLHYSNMLNQQRQENDIPNQGNYNYSERNVTNDQHGNNSKNDTNKYKVSTSHDQQTTTSRLGVASKTTKSNEQNRNMKLYSLGDLNQNRNKNKDQRRVKSQPLKRRHYDKYKEVGENGNQNISMKSSSSTRLEGRFFSGTSRRCLEGNEHTDEEDSYTVYKLDDDIQIQRRRRKSLDKNKSEECFKIFAYNNVIELDMQYPPLYSTCIDNECMNAPFEFTDIEKSKLFPQISKYKKGCLKNFKYENHAKGEHFSSIPVTPTSEVTESGYGSYKSKKSASLRKFFTQQENILDNFTSTFRCFDQEAYAGESNLVSTVTTYPVNTSTCYSKTCSRPQSASCPTECESHPTSSRPSSSRQQNQTLLIDNTLASDCSDSSNDRHQRQPFSSKFKRNRFNVDDKPVSYWYNSSVKYCPRPTCLDDTYNQNSKSPTDNSDPEGNVKPEVAGKQPFFSSKGFKPIISKLHCSPRHEVPQIDSEGKSHFSYSKCKPRTPQRRKPLENLKESDESAKVDSDEDKRFLCSTSNSLVALKEKLHKNPKANQNTGGSVDEKQFCLSHCKHKPLTPTNQKLYEDEEYTEPLETHVSAYMSPQRQYSDVWQSDSKESIKGRKGSCKKLLRKKSDIWNSDSKDSVKRTDSRFKELMRTISRPFHTSRKFDGDDHGCSCAINIRDTESKHKHFWFKSYKNRDVNNDSYSKPQGCRLRDIAVGLSRTRCSCSQNSECLQKQVDQCHEYANKVCTESRLRKERRRRQFLDFKEIPLCVLLGKKAHPDTESINTESSNRSNRSKKVIPKLKVLDDRDQSQEVLELNSLEKNVKHKKSKQTFLNPFKKNYFDDNAIENREGCKILTCKPRARIKKTLHESEEKCTKETCQKFINLLENLECTQETSEKLRNLLKESECTKETCKDMRNILNESECTEETCKKLKELLKTTQCTEERCKHLGKLLTELKEPAKQQFLEGAENTSKNAYYYENVTKESIAPLKELLYMIFDKLSDASSEYEQPEEISKELVRLSSESSSKASSQNQREELLELPYLEYQPSSRKLSKKVIAPLKDLVDMVFEKLISDTSDQSLNQQSSKAPSEDNAATAYKNLISMCKDSVVPFKQLLDMAFEKLLNASEEPMMVSIKKALWEFSKAQAVDFSEKSFKDMKTLSETSEMSLEEPPQNIAKKPSHLSVKVLLKEPQQEPSTENGASNISKESLVSLKLMLESVFEELLATSENSLKLSTPSRSVASMFKNSPDLPLIKVGSSEVERSKESAATNKCQRKMHIESPEMHFKEIAMQPEILQKGKSSKDNSERGLSVPSKEIQIKDSIKGFYPESKQPTCSNLRNLSKESKELLEITLQKVLSHSKESLEMSKKVDALTKTIPLKKPLQHSVQQALQTEITNKSQRNSSNELSNELSTQVPKSNSESLSQLSETNSKSLKSLSKESKEMLKDIFNKLLCLSKESVGASMKEVIVLPAEVSLKNSGKHLMKGNSEPPLPEYKKTTPRSGKRLFEELVRGSPSESESFKNFQKNTFSSFSKASDETLKTLCIESKETFENNFKREPESEFSREILSPAESLLIESLQYFIGYTETSSKDLNNTSKEQVVSSNDASTQATIESLTGSSKIISKKSSKESKDEEISVNKSLEITESPQLPFSSCICTYLNNIFKEPLNEAPKEAIIQILKSLAENLSKDSKEDMHKILQRLFKEAESEETFALQKQTSLPEEFDISTTDVTLKESGEHSDKLLSKMPHAGCTKATCDYLKKVPKESTEEESVQVLTSPSTVELRGSTERLPTVLETVSKSTSNLSEESKEKLEDIFQQLLTAPSKEVLEETFQQLLSLSNETDVSKEAQASKQASFKCIRSTCPYLKELTKEPAEASQHKSEVSSELPPQRCTKSTCKYLKETQTDFDDLSPKEGSVQVPKSRSDASLKGSITKLSPSSSEATGKNRSLSKESKEALKETLSTASSKEVLQKLLSLSKEILATKEAAKIPTEISLKELPQRNTKTPSFGCTRSTCKYLEKSSSSEATTKNLRSLSKESKEMAGEILEKLLSVSIEPSNETVEETVEKLLNVSKEKSSSSEATTKNLRSLSKESKEMAGEILEKLLSVSKEPSNETVEETVEKLLNVSKELIKEVAASPTEQSAKLPLSTCTETTCKYLKKFAKDVSSKEASVQVLKSPSRISAISDVSDKTVTSKKDISLSTEDSPFQGCSKTSCKYLKTTSEKPSDLPSKSSLESAKEEILKSASRNLSKESMELLEETFQKLRSLSKESVSSKQVPEETPISEEIATTPTEPAPQSFEVPSKLSLSCSTKSSLETVSNKSLISLSEESKEMLERIFKKLLNLCKESVPSKEKLKEVFKELYSLSKEVAASKVAAVSPTKKKSPQHQLVSECTEETCKNLRESSKEVSVQATKSQTDTSLMESFKGSSPDSSKIISNSLKSLSNDSKGKPPSLSKDEVVEDMSQVISREPSTNALLKQTSKQSVEISLKGGAKTTSKNLSKSSKTPAGMLPNGESEHNPSGLSEPDAKSLKSLSKESKEELEQIFQNLIRLSKETVASEVPLECTEATCKNLEKPMATKDVLTHDEPPTAEETDGGISNDSSYFSALDRTTSACEFLRNLPKESRELLENFINTSKQSLKILSKEELIKTTELAPEKITKEPLSDAKKQLEESKEPLQFNEVDLSETASVGSASKLMEELSQTASMKSSQVAAETSIKSQLSECVCEQPTPKCICRDLCEEALKLLEILSQNSDKVSKKSTQSKESSQLMEELSQTASTKSSAEAAKNSIKSQLSGCICEQPTPKCICQNLSEESRKLLKILSQNSDDASKKSVQSNESYQKASKKSSLLSEQPAEGSRKLPSETSQYSVQSKRKPLQLMEEFSEASSIGPVQEIAEKSLQLQIAECTCGHPAPKCTCKNLTRLSEESRELAEISLQNSANNLLNEQSQVGESLSETSVKPLQQTNKESLSECLCENPAPECTCESFASLSKESRELLVQTFQNSVNAPKKSLSLQSKVLSQFTESFSETTSTTVSQDAGKGSLELLLSESSENQGSAYKNFTSLSEESVELLDVIFQNLNNKSDECSAVQINEQPQIVESLSETIAKGPFHCAAKDLLQHSKYSLETFTNLPNKSRELVVHILNASEKPLDLLSKGAPQTASKGLLKELLKKSHNNQNTLGRKMCKAKCREAETGTTIEIPDELLKQLCNDVSLQTMIELYNKVSDNKETKLSFKEMVEELCRKKSKEIKLSDVMTQSQLNILKLLHNYRREDSLPNKEKNEDCLCPQRAEHIKNLDSEKHEKVSPVIVLDEEKSKIPPPTKEEKTKVAEKVKQSPPTIDVVHKTTTVADLVNKQEDKNFTSKTKSQESFIDTEFLQKFKTPESKVENSPKTADKRNALQKLKDSLTDKELFETLLDSYEREENIVERLSNDDEFFESQLSLVKSKESIESLLKDKETISKMSEERLLAAMQLGSLSDLAENKLTKKPNISSARIAESTDEIAPRSSKSSKASGLKSKVARLFRSDAVKDIVPPRSDSIKSSIDESYLRRPSGLVREMSEEVLIHKFISTDDLSAEDIQKVKFTRDSKLFHEEKKFLGEDIKRTQKLSRKSSIDSSDTNVVKPTEIGKCFLRGFRSDYMSLGGDTCLLISKQEKEHVMKQLALREESFIEFSERDTPLEYLLALGFSIDEASNAIKDEDVKNRLFAAITEARIWINQISTVQGTLLYLIAYKAKPKIMRYYLQLVEGIINRRIQDAVKLDAFLRLLEKVEDGDLTMINIIGSEKFEDEENEEKIVKKQLRQLFINVFKTAEDEANLKNMPLSKQAVMLLRILAAKYRAGLHPHLELIARYIGQGLLRTEVQLEAAMIYLSRLDTADVNLKEFEHYCGIVCKEDKKAVDSQASSSVVKHK